MGEVDHADNAVNHRIANSHKAINGSERQPVEELLDEILHMSFPHGCEPERLHLFLVLWSPFAGPQGASIAVSEKM
jgi:hypothetical protein